MRVHGLVLAALVLAPGITAAQQRRAASATGPRHEFGVDFGLAWVSPDGADSRFRIGSPLDLRIGFVPRGRVMLEPRLALQFDSEGFTGDATYAITPQLVALYSMTPQRHRRGWYLFGGAGLNFVDFTGGNSGTTFSLGAGAGTRRRVGTAAIRLEGGFRYDTEDSGALMPSQFSIGGRVGLSFWN
jgi:hypothetical protein